MSCRDKKGEWMNRYQHSKHSAIKAGRAAHNKSFVDTIILLIENNDSISTDKKVEIMAMVEHLMKCRKACFEKKIIKQTLPGRR
jgi:hypothetical protein